MLFLVVDVFRVVFACVCFVWFVVLCVGVRALVCPCCARCCCACCGLVCLCLSVGSRVQVCVFARPTCVCVVKLLCLVFRSLDLSCFGFVWCGLVCCVCVVCVCVCCRCCVARGTVAVAVGGAVPVVFVASVMCCGRCSSACVYVRVRLRLAFWFLVLL